MDRRQTITTALAFATATALPNTAFAQAGTTRLVNSFPPAGSVDVVARALAERGRVSLLYQALLNSGPIAEREGVSAAQLQAVREAHIGAVFDDRQRQVLALTDAMTRDITVPEALMTELQHSHSPQQLVELVATVGASNRVSCFLVALNVSH